jgi:hypothetical protein
LPEGTSTAEVSNRSDRIPSFNDLDALPCTLRRTCLASLLLQYHFDQIAKLLSGELISFDIGRQPPLSIENHSVQGV